MATSQDIAFLRHAVAAGYMSESVAQICQRALDTSQANGRQVTVAELAVELGMIDANLARRTADAVRGAPEPTTRLSAVLPLPSATPPFGGGAGPAPFALPRATTPFRMPPPAPLAPPPPAPAPPATPDDGDLGGHTLMLQPGSVLPIPPPGTLDDDPPAPAAPSSRPDELSDSDLAELASVTLTDLQTIQIPRTASGRFDVAAKGPPPPPKPAAASAPPPSAAAAAAAEAVKAELARAITEASKSTEAEAVAQVRKAPEPIAAGAKPGSTSSGARPGPARAGASAASARPGAPRKGKGTGVVYLVGAIGLTVGLVGFAVTRKGDEEGKKTVLGVTVATNTEPAPDRVPPPPVGVVPSQPPPPPPPLADPEGVLAAFEEQVKQFVASGAFGDARALEAKLPPDVTADPARRDRVAAARKTVDDAHRLKFDRERRALSEMIDDGDVAGARARARAAAAWTLDNEAERLAREVESTVRKRHEPLAALPSAKLVEVEKLEALVRRLLSEGTDSTFFPNGGVALDYGQAFSALAHDLRVTAPDHPAGVHVDLSRGSLLIVHRLPLAQVLDLSLDFQVLRALTDPKASVALLIGVQTDGEVVGIGTSWDGEPVQLSRSKGLVRMSPEPDKPPTPGLTQRLRLEVTPGPNQGITTTSTVKDLRDGIQRGGQPMPWAQRRNSRGFVAIYVSRADVAISSFRVRGLADLETIKE
jgi:hypothetical protein